MRIGILTFHWATNYGAVLQAYCLQEYLRSLGHDVEIVNYKPKQYDFTWIRFFRHPSLLLSIRKELLNRNKELMLVPFRTSKLSLTKRFYLCDELSELANVYDAVFTGSDQILNPYFATRGERGRASSAYFLGFAANECKKIGYAVSFGCTSYPDFARCVVQPWIKHLDAVSVRESTGLDILKELGFQGHQQVVPDPTILLGNQMFSKLGVEVYSKKKNYTCVYMLRRSEHHFGNVKYIDETHEPLTLEQWLYTISQAQRVITNSYHGMIVAILSHVPFAVLIESGKNAGMNDRFFTLLNALGLENRIVTTIAEVEPLFNREIDFCAVDNALKNYQKIGVDFINRVLQ